MTAVPFARCGPKRAFSQTLPIMAANSNEISRSAATEATCPDRDLTAAHRFVDSELPRGFPRDAEGDT